MPSITVEVHKVRSAFGAALLGAGGGLGGFSAELKDTATTVLAIVGAVMFAAGFGDYRFRTDKGEQARPNCSR